MTASKWSRSSEVRFEVGWREGCTRKMRKKASPRNADMPVFFSRTYCPFCRTNHEWFAKQAWVREGSPAAERKASDFAVVASGPPKRKDATRAAKAKFDSAT